MNRKLATLLAGVIVCVTFLVATVLPSPVSAQDQINDILCTGPQPGCECIQEDASGQCTRWATHDSFSPVGIQEVDEFIEGKEKAETEEKLNLDDTVGDVGDAYGSWVFCGIIDCPNRDGITIGRSFTSSMTNVIAGMMSTPPASTQTYVADLLNSAGVPLAQPAYAQGLGGLGFNALTPILDAWKTFRDLAYLFFVFLFLIIGFLIMFRRKVGQTAITAQQAIPQIIVALLAVTFSYAIAGLLIDFMYIVMFLMIGIFGVSQDKFLNLGPADLAWTLVVGGGETGYDAVRQFLEGILGNSVVAQVGQFLGGLTAGVVVAVAIAIGIFRLLMELLRTYVTIVISITLSPLLLMMEAIPGRKTFIPWVSRLAANLATFPILLLLLIIYDKITGGFGSDPAVDVTRGGFSPPFLFGGGSLSTGAIPFVLGIGMLMIITDLLKEAKKAIGAGGGVFDVFENAFKDSLKKGWNGGQLVPGLGFTDTSRIPVFGSGKDVLRKATIAGTTVVPAVVGGGLSTAKLGARAFTGFTVGTSRPIATAAQRAEQGFRWGAETTKDPHINWILNRGKKDEKGGGGSGHK